MILINITNWIHVMLKLNSQHLMSDAVLYDFLSSVELVTHY